MKLIASLAAMILVVLNAFVHAAEPDVNQLPPPASRAGVTYTKDIRPLFEASCFYCHGERRQRAGLRLDSLEAVRQGSDEIKVIIPGDSRNSPLIHAIARLDEESAMPPKARTNGGFNLGEVVARGYFDQGDVDRNGKLTGAEFSGLAGTWFDQLDTNRSGALQREHFLQHFADVLPEFQFGDGGRTPGGQRGGAEGFSIGALIAPSTFGAFDHNTNGALTRTEMTGTFSYWFSAIDTNKSDAFGREPFAQALAAYWSRGSSSRSSRRGTNDASRASTARTDGPPSTPLTPEQIGLMRAWIDQGAQ